MLALIDSSFVVCILQHIYIYFVSGKFHKIIRLTGCFSSISYFRGVWKWNIKIAVQVILKLTWFKYGLCRMNFTFFPCFLNPQVVFLEKCFLLAQVSSPHYRFVCKSVMKTNDWSGYIVSLPVILDLLCTWDYTLSLPANSDMYCWEDLKWPPDVSALLGLHFGNAVELSLKLSQIKHFCSRSETKGVSSSGELVWLKMVWHNLFAMRFQTVLKPGIFIEWHSFYSKYVGTYITWDCLPEGRMKTTLHINMNTTEEQGNISTWMNPLWITLFRKVQVAS